MKELYEMISKLLNDEVLIKAVISNKRKGADVEYKKVNLKPVSIKNQSLIQCTYFVGNQVKHKNLSLSETINEIMLLMENSFRQMMVFSTQGDYQVLVSKKGKLKIIKKQATRDVVDLSHNRQKEYILKEGIPYPFLVYLGVMTEDGTVRQKRYDKFRQLNRYLEIVRDVIDSLDQKTVRIVDFGCGKAYLTFALYHYLVHELGRDVEIVGLDLKDDVIEFCNQTALALGFDHLKFIKGDIQSFERTGEVDMVISLHACDTATDDSLIKGIRWGAEVILAVPCCQHELFPQMNSETMKGLLKYGIYRERIAALVTDALRASMLEQEGYEVDAIEFVAMEHTAKNIMLRAVKTDAPNPDALREFEALKEAFGITTLHMEKHL